MKFLVPNYSCLQNPWLGGYHPQIPVLSVLNWICWPPPSKKIPGYATGANQNTTNWNTLTARSPAVGLSVCRETKTRMKLTATNCPVSVCGQIETRPIGTSCPQRVAQYRSAGEQKYCRLEPNGRNKSCCISLQGNKKQPVGTNLTARTKLLIAFSSFPSLHHR